MAKPFFDRLKKYFENVGQVLRGEAEVASVFPNTSDIGLSRELVYSEFLKQHAPSKCNVFLGGFLFGENGDESKQLDIIISTDTAPRYNFYNKDGKGKSFGPVEGCLGVASIKSTLDKNQLIDSLEGIASIPAMQPLGKRVNPMIILDGYEDWPYKIIYASDGLTAETILGHLNDFYKIKTEIPITRRPDIIHVAGKYVIFRIKKGMQVINADRTPLNTDEGVYHIFNTNPDTQAMIWTLDELQKKATATNHINFNYSEIINKINGL
ncbi:MAG: hypothetical protein HOO86_02250 [Bacteroidales bacterium]|nr:hypothetical protein [Bacteroidales bacterium]